MLTDELELIKSLSSTLASFKEEPVAPASRGGRDSEQSRDKDVWPSPTPHEPRYIVSYTLRILCTYYY